MPHAITQTDPAPPQAAAMVLGAMAIIGAIDNGVPLIAAEAGLWQFHATRSAMILPVLVAISLVFGWRLRPKRWRAVLARSGFVTCAMLIYFGCLAVIPIGQVTAGLFTSPLFVLAISAAFLGERIGGRRIAAAALGFAGILLILQPGAVGGLSPVAVLPVAAGAAYAVGVIGTRQWCAEESAACLLAAFFAMIGLCGVIGGLVTAALPDTLRDSGPAAAAFVLRGWEAAPGRAFWIWTAIQAIGSLVAVGMLTRAYQLAAASRLAVFEYSLLVFAPLWALVLRGETLGPLAVAGMAAVAAAGVLIARGTPAARPPLGATEPPA